MTKDLKILIGSIVFTLLLVIGFAFWQGGKGNANEEVYGSEVQGVEVIPSSYNLGEIPMKGGNVIKTFEVKNTTGNTIKLKKIATSCMCTKAKAKVGDNETREFGMEGIGDKNPPISIDIPSGETALVTAIFDPAAHGPKGVGAFDRSVYLTFSDPAGIKELKFNGIIINK